MGMRQFKRLMPLSSGSASPDLDVIVFKPPQTAPEVHQQVLIDAPVPSNIPHLISTRLLKSFQFDGAPRQRRAAFPGQAGVGQNSGSNGGLIGNKRQIFLSSE
jgi:hypothetical protein